MKRSYSFISILLSLVIILGMQSVVSDKAYAADMEFTGVKLKGDVLSWSPVTDLKDSYNLEAYAPDGRFISKCDASYYTSYDLNLWFDSITGLKKGDYKIVLAASDTHDNDYRWEGKYSYDKVELNPIRKYNVDEKSGMITWSHDRSNVSDADVYYQVNIEVDDYSEEFEFKLTDTKLSFMDFVSVGTHKYHITLKPKADGYRSGVGIDETRELTISKGSSITGITVREDDIISWDEVEGADYYRVQCNIGFHMVDYKATQPCYFTLSSLHMYKSEPMTYTYYISAYKGDKRIAYGNTADYKYESTEVKTYPIRINDTTVDSRSYITNLIQGDEGSVAYFPAENKLVLNDFVMSSSKTESEKIFISYNGSVTIAGNGVLTSNGFGVFCSKDLTFAEGCDIKVSADKVSVYGNNVIVNGKLTACSKNSVGVQGSESIVISGKDAFLSTSTESSSKKARAVYLSGGSIDLGGLNITVPKGGKISDDSTTIVNPDGTYARSVMIGVPTATPKPTVTPTATPIPTATATPTAKATTKPTTKPTTAPTSKPNNNPTTVSSKDPKVQILDFVNRIYKYVLNRDPEAEGAAFWSDELYSFRRTGAEVAQGFIFSPEFENRKTSDKEFVTILYKTFFGRDPEEEGVNFWLDQLKTGAMDRTKVANGFIYSQEWANTCASYGIRSGGDIKPTGNIEPTKLTYSFVERMYTTAMGRTYDEEGRQYWASELANFNVTGEYVGAAFFLSDEMTNYKLDDKEFLNRLYKTFMDREADEGGAEYWLGVMASGTQRSDVVFGFTRSEEFTNKCVEARILPY